VSRLCQKPLRIETLPLREGIRRLFDLLMPTQPMHDNIAITYLRWIIAIPAGLLAWFGANHSIEMTFGFVHGYDLLDSFWEAPDMDGMLIKGTYIILITRIVAAASFVAVIIYIVPRYHKQVALAVTSLVFAATIAFLAFIAYQAASANIAIGAEGWYRYILDMLSIIIGAIFGAWMAYGSRKRRIPAS
jgi:hypothetical protein